MTHVVMAVMASLPTSKASFTYGWVTTILMVPILDSLNHWRANVIEKCFQGGQLFWPRKPIPFAVCLGPASCGDDVMPKDSGPHGWSNTIHNRVFMSRHCQNPSVCATRTCVLSMCPLEKVSTSILAHGALGILYRNFKAMLCQASVSTQQSCPFLKTSPDIQLLARHNGIYVVYNPDGIFDDVWILHMFFLFPDRFVRFTNQGSSSHGRCTRPFPYSSG